MGSDVLELTDEIRSVLNYMTTECIPINCHNITPFFEESWDECPLCGAPKEYDGEDILVNHRPMQ